MEIDVRDNPDRSRYEIFVHGEPVGWAAYRVVGDAVVVPHTEIDPAHQGQGLGAALVEGVLDDLRRRGLTVVPRCPFVARYIDDHPEYRDLLAA